MSEEIVVRKKWDRIRYAVILEIILLVIFIPLMALVYDRELARATVLGLSLSAMAVLFTVLFNYVFDYVDVRRGNVPTQRSVRGRAIHAIGFELSFLILSVPFIVWWMHVSVWTAITLDIGLTVLVIVLTFFYTLIYDKLVPVLQS